MANGSVNLSGFDPSRTDDSPKYTFGRWAQQWQRSGKPWGADAIRAFVAQDPRWELDDPTSLDPKLRVRQSELDKWKPGQSVWQDVIGDAGGQNRIQYQNMGGSAPLSSPTTGTSPQVPGSPTQTSSTWNTLAELLHPMSQQEPAPGTLPADQPTQAEILERALTQALWSRPW